MNYDNIINNILTGMNLTRNITEKEYEDLINRLDIVNAMVVSANGKDSEYQLRSTQIISHIMFNYLRELGVGFNE